MTLITAVLGGPALGYFLGWQRRAWIAFIALWLVVLAFQTTVVLEDERIPPEDWAYVPVQFAIFLIGLGLIWLGARVRRRFRAQVASS